LMNIRLLCSLVVSNVLVAGVLLGPNLSAQAKVFQSVVEQIEVNAPVESVFEAIRKERDATNHNRHLVSCEGPKAIIKEKLKNVPLYGDVDCLWQEKEVPFERIDYILLESDKFKAGHGSWVLTPTSDKKSTIVELNAYIDTGLRLPFVLEMTKMAGHGSARKRLEYIKSTAETLYGGCASKNIEGLEPVASTK
jgi:hypothetical protein